MRGEKLPCLCSVSAFVPSSACMVLPSCLAAEVLASTPSFPVATPAYRRRMAPVRGNATRYIVLDAPSTLHHFQAHLSTELLVIALKMDFAPALQSVWINGKSLLTVWIAALTKWAPINKGCLFGAKSYFE